MFRIRWATIVIALGCLLATGRPVAARAATPGEAAHASAQGLKAASARAAHAERTSPQDRPACRHPAPAHRSTSHPRISRHHHRTHHPHTAPLADGRDVLILLDERIGPDRFRAQIGETKRALGSRGPPRASPLVSIARVEPPPFSAAPSVLSVSPAHCIRAPPRPVTFCHRRRRVILLSPRVTSATFVLGRRLTWFVARCRFAASSSAG